MRVNLSFLYKEGRVNSLQLLSLKVKLHRSSPSWSSYFTPFPVGLAASLIRLVNSASQFHYLNLPLRFHCFAPKLLPSPDGTPTPYTIFPYRRGNSLNPLTLSKKRTKKKMRIRSSSNHLMELSVKWLAELRNLSVNLVKQKH